MGCQPGPNYGTPTIIQRERCSDCDGKGFRWRVPDDFNPFSAGGWNTINAMFKTPCAACHGVATTQNDKG